MRGRDCDLESLPTHLANRSGDKLARWCVMGLQGAIGARVMEPVYISGIIIGKTGCSDDEDASAEALNLRLYLKVKKFLSWVNLKLKKLAQNFFYILFPIFCVEIFFYKFFLPFFYPSV